MTTSLNTGVLGAKRQSFHATSPRSVLLEEVERNPRASEERLFDIVAGRLLEGDPDRLLAVLQYWFANEYRRLTRDEPADRKTAGAGVRAAADAIKAKLADHIEHRAKIVLLEMLMPNGKPLRDCRREECAQAGGWFVAVADRLKPDQRVGDALTEADLGQIFEGLAP